jgi:class 3 adenylate cyclase
MVARDEEGTLRTLESTGDLVAEHGGRILGTAGDSSGRVFERGTDGTSGGRNPGRPNVRMGK